MDEKRFEFYRQQYALLMRAVCTAIFALDGSEPERARKVLADAWDSSVETSFQTLVVEPGQ